MLIANNIMKQNIPNQINQTLNRLSPVRFFTITALIFGSLFLLLTPPFQTPDEPVHFYRSYQVSEGIFSVQQHGDKAGGELPSSLLQTVNLAYTPDIRTRPDLKYPIDRTKQALHIKENPNARIVYDISATAYTPAISYAPQAIGITIARIFNSPPIVMMYIARFMVMCTWIVLMAFAISLMPKKKWALAALALLPMLIFQAASLSVDAVAYGVLAILFALILKYTTEQTHIDYKRAGLLAALFTVVVLSKQVMFVFLLLSLILPGKSFNSVGDRVVKIALMTIVPLLIFAAWMVIARSVDITSSAVLHPIPGDQISNILHDPLSYLYVLFRTYFLSYGDGITRSFIGSFGWLDTPMAEFFTGVGYITLAFLYICNYESAKTWLNSKAKLLIALAGVAYFIGVTTAIYVFYDPVKYKSVIGLQGRYFVPVAMMLIPLLYGTWLKSKQTDYIKVAIVAPAFLLFMGVLTLVFRYYVVL